MSRFPHLTLHHVKAANATLARLLAADLWPPPCWFFAVMSVLYVVVAVHTPLSVLAGAPHDDGLYMLLGTYLSQGWWLGPYSQFTLMKGPGYPVFLALGNVLGLSASLAHALLHCAVVTFFTVACRRFVRSAVLSASMFMLLLWQPLPLTAHLLRILRDQIYYAQLLLVLALLVLMLFSARRLRSKFLLGAAAGVSLGWMWLTRDETAWVVPAIVLLVAAGVLHALRARRLLELAASLLVAFAAFAAVHVGFDTANLLAYGKFVGVDFKETNFQRALGALHSVRSGKVQPFVAVTRETRERIYAVSPAFKAIAQSLDKTGRGAEELSCSVTPSICGEIGAGWFVWTLRDAAAADGYYQSPAKASAFFGQIADEIAAACQQGRLACKPQLIAEMPPLDWSDVAQRLPSRYARAFALLTATAMPLEPGPSIGSDWELAYALRLLNHPRHSPTPAQAAVTAATAEPALARTQIERFVDRNRAWIVVGYDLAFRPVLGVGAIAFLAAALLYWRRIAYEVCFVLALACWMLVFLRASLLVLIDATSFPALFELYLTPAYFMAAAAAVLSIAAWFRLSVSEPQSADHAASRASPDRRPAEISTFGPAM